MSTLENDEQFNPKAEAEKHLACIKASLAGYQVQHLVADPRKAQLLALFDLSDKRGQDLLLQIAGIHAARYPKVPA